MAMSLWPHFLAHTVGSFLNNISLFVSADIIKYYSVIF